MPFIPSSLSLNEALFLVQGGCCYLCGGQLPSAKKQLPGRPKGEDATRDHIVPRWFGASVEHNIALAHYACNTKKAGRQPTAEERTRGFEYSRIARSIINHCRGYFDRLHDWEQPAYPEHPLHHILAERFERESARVRLHLIHAFPPGDHQSDPPPCRGDPAFYTRRTPGRTNHP